MRDPIAWKIKTRIGGYAKNGNAEGVARARHELELHELAQHIQRVSLTDKERADLAAMLSPAVAV